MLKYVEETKLQRYPDNTKADLEDFRRCNWQAVIGQAERNGYSGLWQALSTAAKAAIEDGRNSEGRVLWLMADVCSMILKPNSPNAPFLPMMVVASGRSPIPDDFQGPDLDLISQMALEVSDPRIQGRLADLAWLLRIPRDPKYALIAIDSYRKIPLDVETWLRDGRECWHRAISLTKMLRMGAGQRLSDLEKCIVAAFRGATEEDGFQALWLADLLRDNGLRRDESLDIGNKLKTIAESFEKRGDFHKARSFLHGASDWFKRANKNENWIAVTVLIAEGWAKEAAARMSSTVPSSAVAASFYENAIRCIELFRESSERPIESNSAFRSYIAR